MPKAELHLHLDGTLEPELKFVIAARNGIELAETSVEEIRASYQFDSLATFLAVHYPNMTVLWTEEDYYDLCYTYLAKAASQGVRHTEMFFDPQLHTSRGVPFSTVIRGYRRAITDARTTLGISGELIMCILRDYGVNFAMATLMESLPYKDWIIGIGLDSDEQDNPPAKFAEVFARARAEGYLLTMHCDIDQENSIEHLRQVIEDIKVDRIDHGTNILESPELVAEVKRRGIGLTTCPLSNSFVSPGMKAAEITELLRQGVRVSINSDDPPYFGGYVGENLVAIATMANFGAEDMVQLQRNAFESSWLAPHRRDAYLAELEEYARTALPQAR
jgi:adenosine deaminase